MRLAILLIFLTICCSAGDFSVKIDCLTEYTAPGQNIPLTLHLDCPDDYRPAAWLLTVFRSDVPSAFPQALALENRFSKAKRPEWSYCSLGTKWFRKDDQSMQKEIQITTTPEWPCGDYRIVIRVLFRKEVPSVETDKYISQPVLFTLEVKRP